MALTPVCEALFEAEREFDLLDLEVEGFPLWVAMRLEVSQRIAGATQGMGPAQRQPKRDESLLARAKRVAQIYLTSNPLRASGATDAVLLEHCRVKDLGGEPGDIYSSDLVDEWREAGRSFRRLTGPWGGVYGKRLAPERYATDALRRQGLRSARRRPLRFSPSQRSQMSDASRMLRARLGGTYELEDQLLRRGTQLARISEQWERVFANWTPQEFFLVVGYGANAAAVAAAQRCGIRVTEIQHGTFSPVHLGYSYPERSTPLRGFPDRLLVWNEAWKRRVPFQESVCSVEVRRPGFLVTREQEARRFSRGRDVLVLSQGSLGDRIAEALTAHLDCFEGRRIRYKLHPGEYARYQNYPSLRALVDSGRVEVFTEANFTRLLAECETVVGVYSTGVYEALDMGCEALLLDLPGVEAMADLIASGEVRLLARPQA